MMVNFQKILQVANRTETIHSGILNEMNWIKFVGFETATGEFHGNILQSVKEWIYLGVDKTKTTSGSD